MTNDELWASTGNELMTSFVEEFFRRMREDGEDGYEAGLELALLLELHNRPHPNRERTTRQLIGDSLVDRGLTGEEAELVFQYCLGELKQSEKQPDDWLARMVQVLIHSEDERMVRPLFEALPSMVTESVVRQQAAHNALELVGGFTIAPEYSDLRKPLVEMLAGLQQKATDRFLRETISEILENNGQKMVMGVVNRSAA